MKRPTRQAVVDLARHLTVAGLLATSGVMVLKGLFDDFQLDNGDYAQWREYVGGPLLGYGLVAGLFVVCSVVVAWRHTRRRRIAARCVLVVATVIAGYGIVRSQARSSPDGAFRDAFAKLHLGPGFVSNGVVTTPGNTDLATEEPPSGVETWTVSRPATVVCAELRHAVERWAGAAITPTVNTPAEECSFHVKYRGGYLVTFWPDVSESGKWPAPTDAPWVLRAGFEPYG